MKKLITFLTIAFIANLSISQIVFQSDLSSWSGGNPTDFFGSKTSVSAANVTEVTSGATYGTSFANLINTSNSHKRFTTQAVTVVPGTTYVIKMWAGAVSSDTTDMRVSLYDLTNSAWTAYKPYQDVIGSTSMYIDSVVAPAGCTSLEFIISFRNTNALGFRLDSVSISGPLTPPPPLSQIDLPVTFEDTTVDYTMTDFGNNASMKMIDPTNASNTVMRIIKPTGAQTWAGTTISTPTGLASAIPFTATDQKMTVKVWSPASGTPILFKVEDASNGAINSEVSVNTTVAGWDSLVFDFSTATSAINPTNTYNKASIFMDFGTAGAQDTFYFDDVMFMVSPPPALSQIDLPVTFEDTTVDYTMTDFGGNASTLSVDPTAAGNNVMCVIKTTGAQTWAGTTLGTATGFANAIPFTATDQKITARVWSGASGTPVRLKVEDATDNTVTCETEALTVTAGGWDTLTFDFGSPASGTAALNIANTYDKASLFFDFGTAGAQDTFYFDDVMFMVSPPPALSQIDLPVTFEDTTVDYTMTDFGGNASTLSVDPTAAGNNVMCVIKTTGAQTWAGTTLGTATGFANAIPFTATDQKITARVWSGASGTPVRLKVEDATDNTVTCETEALTVTAGGWDTLTFDFGSPASGTAALNIANTYDKASLFFDFGTAGAQDTFYFDDVMFMVSPPPALSQIDLPVTFEDTTVDYTMTDFGGNASTLSVDPTTAGNNVMCVIKTTGAQTWAGTTLGTATGFANAIPFTATDQKITARVWSGASGTPVRLKVEDATDNTVTCETEALTVTAGGWDTLTFDFGSPASGTAALNIANTYDKASLFFDFGTAGAQDTFYFDDVMFMVSPPPALSQIDLPVTFEDTTVDYTMTDFGGNASTLSVDPTTAGNNVMCVIKTTGAQTWAGTTLGTATGFANAIPFTATDQKITARVWSGASGTPVRLKVEDATDNTVTCETEALTVTAGGWDTLTFDFGSPASGTAALNIANTYDKASLFFDFGTAGAQDTFYFDDVMFMTTPPAVLAQINLPVTFEDTAVDYTMTDFGGNASTLSVDPTDPTNMAMCVIKTAGAQTWAGTTVGTPSGFMDSIPFTATGQKMTVRVWSAAAGKPIRLKVEDASNGSISCETEALTVTAGGWDTLTFDFGSPASGTAALNIANTYDKASLFFDFGTVGALDTFYFDDVMFGGDTTTPPPPSKSQIDLTVTFEDTTVDYTMTDFGGNASTLVVDPTNASNRVMEVVKTAGAQTWAGTTIGTSTGFATLLPFTTTDHVMSVKVWSPDSNTVIRLKVEDANDVTHTCETEATTTINGGWEILNFDFSNEATGTATLASGLTAGWVYNKASIFFDFGNTGSGKIYRFDDVKWGGVYAGTRELQIENLTVYPNPTSNNWNITADGNRIIQIDIFDLKGNLIETSTPNSNKVKVDATSYPSGMYILKATTETGVANKRVVKN